MYVEYLEKDKQENSLGSLGKFRRLKKKNKNTAK